MELIDYILDNADKDVLFKYGDGDGLCICTTLEPYSLSVIENVGGSRKSIFSVLYDEDELFESAHGEAGVALSEEEAQEQWKEYYEAFVEK